MCAFGSAYLLIGYLFGTLADSLVPVVSVVAVTGKKRSLVFACRGCLKELWCICVCVCGCVEDVCRSVRAYSEEVQQADEGDHRQRHSQIKVVESHQVKGESCGVSPGQR